MVYTPRSVVNFLGASGNQKVPKIVYQELFVKNIIGLVTITQVFVLIFECQKPLILQNLAKNSALKRLIGVCNG